MTTLPQFGVADDRDAADDTLIRNDRVDRDSVLCRANSIARAVVLPACSDPNSGSNGAAFLLDEERALHGDV
jgi:hypothetical protein